MSQIQLIDGKLSRGERTDVTINKAFDTCEVFRCFVMWECCRGKQLMGAPSPQIFYCGGDCS